MRAFMDQILIIKDHGKDFIAWDMASGHEVDRPFKSQEVQIWWEDCRARDALKTGEMCLAIFYIYNCLAKGLGPDGRRVILTPIDATYVLPDLSGSHWKVPGLICKYGPTRLPRGSSESGRSGHVRPAEVGRELRR